MIATISTGIAGLICLLIPTSTFSTVQKVILFLAVVTVIHLLTMREDDPEDDFRSFLEDITLPGKEHTLRRPD